MGNFRGNIFVIFIFFYGPPFCYIRHPYCTSLPQLVTSYHETNSIVDTTRAMAEALQIAGAAFGVADLAFKIYKELSTFVERARDADITAKSLTVRIQRFRRVVEIVHLTAARRRTVVSLGLEHRDEGKIWSAISDSLNGWETALARFKAGIEASHLGSSQETKVNWIGKALLQLKLDRKNPWIERLEIDIGTHIDEISLSLNCLQMYAA